MYAISHSVIHMHISIKGLSTHILRKIIHVREITIFRSSVKCPVFHPKHHLISTFKFHSSDYIWLSNDAFDMYRSYILDY